MSVPVGRRPIIAKLKNPFPGLLLDCDVIGCLGELMNKLTSFFSVCLIKSIVFVQVASGSDPAFTNVLESPNCDNARLSTTVTEVSLD